jgi:hypothetical protein
MNSREQARQIWKETIPWNDQRAESLRRYLSGRGLDPGRFKEIQNCMRFHLGLAYWQGGKSTYNFPAVIFKVTNPEGQAQALHRIYLTEDGNKAPVDSPKKLLGPANGGSIKFAGSKEDTVLHLTEGPETALCIYQVIASETWSFISTSGMKNIEIPMDKSIIHIWVDNDESNAGLNAATSLAERLHSEGRSVYLHLSQKKWERTGWTNLIELGLTL